MPTTWGGVANNKKKENFMKTTDKNIPFSSEFAINLLHEPHKTIAKLRILEKKTYKIIANELNITEGKCRTCVWRAKKKLKILDNMLLHRGESEISLEDLIKKWLNTKIDGMYI